MKIKHLAFTMYPVKDMKRARKFYEKVLGLEVGNDWDGKWVEYFPGSGCFALTNMIPMKPAMNMAFEVDDLDAAVKRLTAAKSKCVYKPYDTPVCRFAAFRDTEGNSFMLHQKKRR